MTKGRGVTSISPLLLIVTVAAVGVLHTLVPDHWAPIALLARQKRWSRRVAMQTAAGAGIGHAGSTLVIAAVVWIAGIALAQRLGSALSAISSIALVAFGLWIAIAALRELRQEEREGRTLHAAIPTRTALLLILGSSPMVEGIPAFFAAARYGWVQLAIMSGVFAASTIVTYVGVVAISLSGLERLSLGKFERYGEVLSGAFVAIVGAAFFFLQR
jgi:L-cystine uptake protein TcyP (sodium:dicarboxylate symporter family)